MLQRIVGDEFYYDVETGQVFNYGKLIADEELKDLVEKYNDESLGGV